MKYTTPNDMIAGCVKNIERFLHEGMQQHAADELEATISRINRFHERRLIQDEISDIADVIALLDPMHSKYADNASEFLTMQGMLEAIRERLVDKLEAMK